MTSSPTPTPATVALNLAAEVLASAVEDAANARWATCPEQRYDAARYLLNGQRLLDRANQQPSPLVATVLTWDAADDGWAPRVDVLRAIRGDVSAAQIVLGDLTAAGWTR